MSENNSGNNTGNNNSRNKKRFNRNRKNNNRNHRNNNNANNSAQAQGQGQNQPQGNRKPQSGNANRNRRPKSLSPGRIIQKYDNLLEQYIVARKKFFELFGRTSGKQLSKVESNYTSSLKSLRDFETKLEDWQKEVLNEKINGYKEDRDYSTNHDLKPQGDIVSFVGEFEDPHLLPKQKATDWSQDTEESSGTMEDYEKYKASL